MTPGRFIIPILLAACALLMRHAARAAEAPPFLSAPEEENSMAALPEVNAKELREEAQTLQRKANLLKEAANKKYAESKALREKAGTYRAQAGAASQTLQRRAADSAEIGGLVNDLLGMVGAASPMPRASDAAALNITSKVMSASRASDARSMAEAQTAVGKMEMEAEKSAGPLEMKAQALEDDGNRLLAAYNRLQSLANAKSLLLASEELRQAILQDREFLAAAKKRF